MITTIYNNLTIDIKELREWLQVQSIDLTSESNDELEVGNLLEDNELQTLIDSAKRKADSFVQREPDYFREDDESEVDIPEDIKQWCLEYAGRAYEKRINGMESISISGSESTSWGEVEFNKLKPYRKLDFGRIIQEEDEDDLGLF